MKDKTGIYYHPKKNKIEIFQIDRTVPSMGVDYSWYEDGHGWSKTKKGVPSDDGWVWLGEFEFKKETREQRQRWIRKMWSKA